MGEFIGEMKEDANGTKLPFKLASFESGELCVLDLVGAVGFGGELVLDLGLDPPGTD